MQNENPLLNKVFEQALVEKPAFVPEDLPNEWTVGQHRYIRVPDVEGRLSKQLDEFREAGVRVLDYGRRWGSWIFKTMAEGELSS